MKHGQRINREYAYRESEDKFEMGCQWIDQNNLEKAEDCLKRSIELNENFIYAYITLAEVYGKQNRWHDGISLLKKASGTDPYFDRLPYMIARFALEAGDFISALRFIGRAIELNPDPAYRKLEERIKFEMSVP